MKKFFTELTSDKRIMSFIWRTSMMIVAFTAEYGVRNLTGMGIENPTIILMLGLLLGEVSKAANNALKTEY